jgi:hypothetical protein
MGVVKFSLCNFRRLCRYMLNVIGVEDELWCSSLCTLTKEAVELRETSVHFYQTARRHHYTGVFTRTAVTACIVSFNQSVSAHHATRALCPSCDELTLHNWKQCISCCVRSKSNRLLSGRTQLRLFTNSYMFRPFTTIIGPPTRYFKTR